MAKLKVPSLQHLARNWRSDAERVKWQLVELAKNSPTFNYNPLYSAVRDMLVLKQPYDQIAEGINRHVKRADVRKNYLEVLPLIDAHFSSVSPDFVQTVEKRYYLVGRGLKVPFEPPLLYGVDGQFHFPWFSFWRTNPLVAERLSLFVTIVDDVLLQDPDLENARFDILDFSVAVPGQGRELRVIDARDIPRISEKAKIDMLRVFAEGYFLAEAELASSREGDGVEPSDSAGDADQPGCFD